MTSSTIAACDHGIVSKTKRVIMERDVYDRKWKLGPFSKCKERLKAEGKLDKFGRPIDTTPEVWKMLFGDAEKPTTVSDVVPAKSNGKSLKKVKEAEDSDEEDEDAKKKDKKAKKDKKKREEKVDKKKDKKEKKDKKKKKADSDSDDE